MKKELRILIALIAIAMPIIVYVGENTKQNNEIVEKFEVLEVQRKQPELKAQKSTVIKTLNGKIIVNEGENPENYKYMNYVHTFSKDGYKNEKDLEKSTGYLLEDVKTRWFIITHYQEQSEGIYEEVKEDTCLRLGFLWQDISIEPKEYEGYIYNEKLSCSEITNGLPSSVDFSDITYDIELYYDLVE